MDLILFGRQGAGKGTLGKYIAAKYNMQIFETGGELRKLAAENSELGKKIKAIIESGQLVSNDIVMEIVEHFMKNMNTNTPILFDGIPRSIIQAKTLNELLHKYERKFTAVLINISEKTALDRLTSRKICNVCKAIYPKYYKSEACEQIIDGKTCNGKLISRKDDVPEAIAIRLKAYAETTVPAIDVYEGRLIKIDGEQSIKDVQKEAEQKLSKIM